MYKIIIVLKSHNKDSKIILTNNDLEKVLVTDHMRVNMIRFFQIMKNYF